MKELFPGGPWDTAVDILKNSVTPIKLFNKIAKKGGVKNKPSGGCSFRGVIIERDEIETAAGNSPKAVRAGVGRAHPASHHVVSLDLTLTRPAVCELLPSVSLLSSFEYLTVRACVCREDCLSLIFTLVSLLSPSLVI